MRVSCGLFGIGDDHIENYQSLDERFIRNKASTFFFEAASDSMEPLIFEKDVLVVDRSLEVVSGRVIVFSIHGEMFCKRFFKNGNEVILRSENPKYKDVKLAQEEELHIFGVVISVVKDLMGRDISKTLDRKRDRF